MALVAAVATAVFAFLVSLTAILFADFMRYAHNLRISDMNVNSNILLSEGPSKETADIYRDIAKSWVAVSIGFRTTSFYVVMQISYLVLGSIFCFVSLILAVFLEELLPLVLLFLLAGVATSSLAFVPQTIRYYRLSLARPPPRWSNTLFSFVEFFGWKFAEKFPPLPSVNPKHLGIWGMLRDYEKIEWLRAYLEGLPSWQDLERLRKRFGDLRRPMP